MTITDPEWDVPALSQPQREELDVAEDLPALADLDCEPGDCTPWPRYEILRDHVNDPVVVDHASKFGYPFYDRDMSGAVHCLAQLRRTGECDYVGSGVSYEFATEPNVERGRE